MQEHGDPLQLVRAVGVREDRLEAGLDVLRGRVVVLAEHVDDPVVAAPELVEVIGDVGQPVGRLARALDDHAVVGAAVLLRPEPDRIVLVVGVATGPEALDDLRDLVGLVEVVLVEEPVERDAEPRERRLDNGKDALLGERLERLPLVVAQRVAVVVDELARELGQVLAAVEVVRELGFLARLS